MSTKKKTTRSTGAQIKMLIEFMKAHPNFANGEFSGPMGHRAMTEEWEHLGNLLKAYGPDKSIEQWKHTWRDIKKRAREEGARVKRARAQTGNMPVPNLSEQSVSVLSVIGNESAFGIDSLEETGIGEMLVVVDGNTAQPPLTHSAEYSNSLITYDPTPTTHTITQYTDSLTYSLMPTTHTITQYTDSLTYSPMPTTHTITQPTSHTLSLTRPTNQTHQQTAFPEHPLPYTQSTMRTISQHKDSLVSVTPTTRQNMITQPTTNTQTNHPTTSRTLPQPSSRPQRRRMRTRASDFLTAEGETRNVLRNIANQLEIPNCNFNKNRSC